MDGAELYDNERCAICGKRMMTTVNCRLHQGDIHMVHCANCEYFQRMFWHCIFRTPEEIQAQQDMKIKGNKDENTKKDDPGKGRLKSPQGEPDDNTIIA